MSTNVPNLKQIGGGHRKNGQKFVDLMWNDPKVFSRLHLFVHKIPSYMRLEVYLLIQKDDTFQQLFQITVSDDNI